MSKKGNFIEKVDLKHVTTRDGEQRLARALGLILRAAARANPKVAKHSEHTGQRAGDVSGCE